MLGRGGRGVAEIWPHAGRSHAPHARPTRTPPDPTRSTQHVEHPRARVGVFSAAVRTPRGRLENACPAAPRAPARTCKIDDGASGEV